MSGILVFNGERPDIMLENGFLYGGLHCGDCFVCYFNEVPTNVRLEYKDDWVLLHNNQVAGIPYGINVEIQ